MAPMVIPDEGKHGVDGAGGNDGRREAGADADSAEDDAVGLAALGTGNHRSTNWLAAGYIVASPAPSANRTRMRTATALLMEGGTSVVRTVKIPHQATAKVSSRREPKRCASSPAGTRKTAYPIRKALKIQRRWVLSIAYSWPGRGRRRS
ncbi:MAG TPA: hypothetical protein VK593_05220 [Edaphobacter sp.]|nr:hypothetical protein [Edaphobacter sp.]